MIARDRIFPAFLIITNLVTLKLHDSTISELWTNKLEVFLRDFGLGTSEIRLSSQVKWTSSKDMIIINEEVANCSDALEVAWSFDSIFVRENSVGFFTEIKCNWFFYFGPWGRVEHLYLRCWVSHIFPQCISSLRPFHLLFSSSFSWNPILLPLSFVSFLLHAPTRLASELLHHP